METSTNETRTSWLLNILDLLEPLFVPYGFRKSKSRRDFSRNIQHGSQRYTIYSRNVIKSGVAVLRLDPSISIEFDCIDRIARTLLDKPKGYSPAPSLAGNVGLFKRNWKGMEMFDIDLEEDIVPVSLGLANGVKTIVLPLFMHYEKIQHMLEENSLPDVANVERALDANQYSRLGLLYCTRGIDAAVDFIKARPSRFSAIGAELTIQKLQQYHATVKTS